MGLFDRNWGTARPQPDVAGSTPASADAQAIARYRYMLSTAPPEAIEQAHAEAFAQLTPDQRRQVLEQLATALSPAERAVVENNGAQPRDLARMATRAEIRQPGVLERTLGAAPAGTGFGGLGGFGGAPGGGFGGMLAGSLLGSIAGSVIGGAIAREFFSHDAHAAAAGFDSPLGNPAHAAGLDDDRKTAFADQDTPSDDGGAIPDDDSDYASGDDADSGGGDFDGGSFDV